MEVTVEINQKFLDTFGTGTLIGYISNRTGYAIASITKVTLVFPESSLRWREKNNGPDSVIVNEYVPKCLIDDILWFASQGIKVVTETLTRDPK